jgi:hypothetical protein
LLYPLSYRPARRNGPGVLPARYRFKGTKTGGIRAKEQRRRGDLPEEDGGEEGPLGRRVQGGGKRKYLYGKTKKAVTDKLRERLSSGEMNLAPEADAMLVGAYLDRWLPTVKERTWARHEEVVRLHLKPTVGRLKLRKLGPLDVQELYLSKLRTGLSPRTVQIVHTTLHKALK